MGFPSLCLSPYTEEAIRANTESYGGPRPCSAEGHRLTLSSGSALASLSSAHRPACSLPPQAGTLVSATCSSPVKALYLVALEARHLGKALRHGWVLTPQNLGQGEYQPQSPPRAHPNSHQTPEGHSLTEVWLPLKLVPKPVSLQPKWQAPEE